MIQLQVAGIIVLSLLIAQGFIIVFLGGLARFTHWLYTHHSLGMMRLRGMLRLPPLEDAGNDSNTTRYAGKYEVWCIQFFEKVHHWVSRIREDKVEGKRNYPKAECNSEYSEPMSVDIPRTSLQPTTRLCFLRPHIRTIVNWLRRRVNQSGKEPLSVLRLTFCISQLLTIRLYAFSARSLVWANRIIPNIVVQELESWT